MMPSLSRQRTTKSTKRSGPPAELCARHRNWFWTDSRYGRTPRSFATLIAIWTREGERCGTRSKPYWSRPAKVKNPERNVTPTRNEVFREPETLRSTRPILSSFKRSLLHFDPRPIRPASLGRPIDDTDLAALKHRNLEPKLPRPRTGEAFMGGPIPMSCIEQAAPLPGKAWQMACALWFEALCSKTKSPTIQLPRRTILRFRIVGTPDAASGVAISRKCRIGQRHETPRPTPNCDNSSN